VLADAPNSDLFPTPCWSPDGESVLFVSWSREEEKAGEPKSRAEGLSLTLERRDVVEGRRELATELSHPPITHVKELRAIRLGLDVEGAQVFYAVAIEGKDVGIHWVYLKRQEVRKFFNPYENSRPVVNLGVCPLPNSTQLVLRFGPLDRPSPPALCDASTEELRALVPDDETRAAWILSIFSTMGQALKTSEVMLGEVEPMPTRLPMPGDIDPSHPAFFRLRELARQGRPLCDRPSDSGPASPELTSLLDEARLVFSYLLGDYSQALAAVEAREEKAGSRDERLRLLGLRAQIHIGMGETDRARAIVEHLRKQMSNGSVRVEETGSGLALVTLPDAAEAWPEMLAIRLDALTNGQGKEGDLATTDDPILDHVNPDAPQPGLGLDPVPVVPPPPIPPGMPIPAQPPAFQIRRLPDQPRAILERRQGPPGSVRVRIVPANPNR
ncbi:MAG TPA: hypothetical protein VFT74_11115, partial [Isosphaeraceae bacterium]|nr:hypothetical protein [Isosphaeraceae bacterium]